MKKFVKEIYEWIKENALFSFSVFFFVLVFVFSVLFTECGRTEKYMVTENQLQALESIQEQQKSLIQNYELTLNDLQTQLNDYRNQTESLKESLRKSEHKITLRNNIISVSVGISTGCIAGVITYNLLKR